MQLSEIRQDGGVRYMTHYTISFFCNNCNHTWDSEIPLRWRVAYSHIDRQMMAVDQANRDNFIAIMCPNCHCLEDVVKGNYNDNFEDQE